MSGLVELARFQMRVEADLARLRLESEGIGAVLFDAETSSVGWGPIMPVRLMVLEEDWVQAEALLSSA
ncbi:MAG: DUF2007 domain-containing protein [Pseudomonadota bacterium]|nr:DUF2007 domain-containing protein [Pseudomonadota bacterium]